MNAPPARKQLEEFAELLAEQRRRKAKAEHSQRGYRDEDGVWRGGLLQFVRDFWHILEPGTKFVDGWALEAVCEHLEAVTFGEIQNLLINVPPGFMKPCDCDTPVLTGSGWKLHGDLAVGDTVYGADGKLQPILARTENRQEEAFEITFDDGSKAIASANHLWSIERDTVVRGKWSRIPLVVKTTDLKPGSAGTRRCADRIRLTSPLDGDDSVLPIDAYTLGAWLGDGASDVGVLSCGALDFPHFLQLGRETAKSNKVHRILVPGLTTKLRNLGLLKNKHIPAQYLNASAANRWALLQGLMDTDGQAEKGGICRFTTSKKHLVDQFVQLACSLGLKPRVSSPFYDKHTERRRHGPYYRVRFTPPPASPVFRLARKQLRVPKKIARGISHRFVVSVKGIGLRWVNCIQVPGSLYLITERFIVTHNSLLCDVYWPAWEWGPMRLPHLRYVAFSYSSMLTERDNGRFKDLILHPDYQALYGTVFRMRKVGETKVSNWKHGWKLATSVGGVGTGERGDRIILDDPHNVKESESSVVRDETTRWFRESMTSRLNNMETGSKIIIMQRVHADDVSGVILSLGMDYVHLMIPMEYVWQADEDGEPYATSIGWVDPRWQPKPQDCDGDLAWPERFSAKVVTRMKFDLGPYACTPAESPILMADLSYKRIEDVRPGEMVVGFTTHTNGGQNRRKTIPTKVNAVHRYRGALVKITLSSGRVIRCTPDHKWYMGKQGGGSSGYVSKKSGEPVRKAMYRPAKEGLRLMRVSYPEDTSCAPENEREAGWLAGFFDGDGSVSLSRKIGTHFKPSSSISFYQGDGRNGPNCEKLEEVLKKFGFGWTVSTDARKTKGANFGYRAYRLLGNDLPMYQKFLHIVRPTKWRDRMLHGALGTKFIIAEETVVGIEQDGEEDVFALETETGNYVVWGLASSNSAGQLQQIPSPRGGGIFKRDWWQPYESQNGTFPQFDYVIASLDGAFTEKESNNPSALTVWGVFEDPATKFNRAMLMHAWRKRVGIMGDKLMQNPGEHPMKFKQRQQRAWGLVEWLADTCTRFKVDVLLIEGKASGISAAQALAVMYPNSGWMTQVQPVKGDKEARALAVVPSFAQGMIYVPYPLRTWAEDTIEEMEVFPRHKHDDLTDSATQAIKHLRDMGLLRSSDAESRVARDEALKPRKSQKPLYPV